VPTLDCARARSQPCPTSEFALRILFAGTPDAAVPSLRAVLDSAHEVVAVLSRPDAPAGRGRKLTASPVAALARSSGLTVLTPDSVSAPAFLAELTALDLEAAAVVGYGKLLPQPVLDAPMHGWINLHFSLLPAWRGAAPVQAAIRAGDELTGATTFRLAAGMDTGPVYGVVTETVRPADTTGQLLGRLAESGARLLVATLDGIADGSLQPRPQPAEGVSLAPKVTPESARIDWAAPALAIDRQIRSLSPEPGAWTDSPWGRLVLGPVHRTEVAGLAPGELRVERRRVLVGTGSDAVQLGDLTAPGKRAMPAADWARGARPDAGTVLGGRTP
jgi:methionyl-tRNA formyltransferase